MPRKSLITVLLSTFLAMASLYGPQPLLPYFARIFDVTEAESASLISWSLLSMSIGPLFMGYLLQRNDPRKMLIWCVAGLTCSTLLFSMLNDLFSMKLVRFLQGGIIAAQLAATMTYITSASTNMRQIMAYYVGAAIMGGLSGRLFAGFVSEFASWRYFFVALGLVFIICLWRTIQLEKTDYAKRAALAFKQFREVLKDRYIIRLYLIIMLSFFVMTGVLNFIPFRLEALNPHIGESTISLFYLGFVIGCFVSINAPRIADIVGSAFKAAWLGIGFVIVGLLLLYIPSAFAVFIAMAFVTSGFFLQHTSIATLLNKYAVKQAGIVNSLYISVYYLGGSAGSYLPGLLYESQGWTAFTSLLLLIVVLCILVVYTTRATGNAFLNVS